MNSKSIAKNTIFLYIRICVMLFVSLISSRLLLKNLGIIDYGVYNVVYGLILFFSFMNGTLTSGTQRFLNFAMGQEDCLELKETFRAAFTNHLLLAGIITLLILVVGNIIIGFLLDIPYDRISQSYILFNSTAISLSFIIISVPYQADIIAHEDMNVFALYSIIDSLLKLLLAYLLMFFLNDNRICIYGFGLLFVSIIDFILYYRYCSKNYNEVVNKLLWKPKLNLEMLKFSGWDTFGWAASSAAGQGFNILLNIFCGPLLNAARGVSVQVYSLMNQLVNSFQNAINPQIVKSYARGETNDTISLMSASSKFSIVLVSFVALPVFIDIDIVLKFWLGNYPELSQEFSRIMILQSLVVGFTRPIVNTMHATGHIKLPCIYSGCTLFLIIPISWILLKIGFAPIIVLLINIIPWIIEGVINFIFVQRTMYLPIGLYFRNVVARPLLTLLLCYISDKKIVCYLGGGISNLILLFVFNGSLLIVLTYICVMTNTERKSANQIIYKKIFKK